MVPATDENLPVAPALVPLASHTATGCFAMREFATLALGYAACESESAAFPFVVRNCADFAPCASEAAVRAAMRLEKEVRGYLSSNASGYTEHLTSTGREALAAWDAGLLKCNIIDSECGRTGGLMPPGLAAIPGIDKVHVNLRLAYVLSPLPGVSGEFGDLHCDPPMGSGWQYLVRGHKTWHCIDDAPVEGRPSAFSRSQCSQMSCPPDMAAVALRARVLTTELRAGDFLSFPQNWPHAVMTLEPSIGLSGYMAIPTAR